MDAIHGPCRDRRDDAEIDRQCVAMAMGKACRSERKNAVVRAIKALGSEATLPVGVPGSASFMKLDLQTLQTMRKKELRNLATQTPGVVRTKKMADGKLMDKTMKELKAELLAKHKETLTQTLSGRQPLRKRPASCPMKRLAARLCQH